MKVLLAGTNHGFLDHMAQILASKVEETRQATNEIELEACLADGTDVVLLDLFDLKARGIRFMKRIKEVLPSTQIICFIPKGEIKLSISAMRHGAFDELQSPFSWPAFLSKLEAAGQEKARQDTKQGFWRSMEDHLVAGSLAQIAGPDFGRDWLQERRKSQVRTKISPPSFKTRLRSGQKEEK